MPPRCGLPLAGRCIARLTVGANIKADDRCTRSFRQRNIGFGDPADGAVNDTSFHFVCRQFFKRLGDRFNRTLHIALQHYRHFGRIFGLQLVHHLLKGAARSSLCRDGFFTSFALTILSDFARLPLRANNGHLVTRLGCAGKT